MAEKLASLRKNGVASDIKADLLWENPTKASNTGFTLNVASSKYSKLLCVCWFEDVGSGWTNTQAVFITHGQNGSPQIMYNVSGYGYVIRSRQFGWTNNVLTVANGWQMIISTSASAYDGSIGKPYQIYGIK